MKPEGLEYFLGKICTVFTEPTNRDFKSENPQTFPQPIFHYFVGKVVSINSKGMFLEQWNTEKKLRTFFFIDRIIAISEEEILDPSDPKDQKLIEEYKQTNEKEMKKVIEKANSIKKSTEEINKEQYLDLEKLAKFTIPTS